MTTKSPIEQLEAATNKVGKAIGDLLVVFERQGQHLDEASQRKVFGFLHKALEGAHQKATVARTIAKATNGAFSLEDADEEIVTPGPVTGFGSPARPAPMPVENAFTFVPPPEGRATIRLRPGQELPDSQSEGSDGNKLDVNLIDN